MVHDPYWDLVREPEEPPFDATRVAMLIIDLQNLCAHPQGWMGRLATDQDKPEHLKERFDFIEEITPNVKRLLNHSRKIGVEVFHIRVAFRTLSTRDGKRQLLNKLEDTPLLPMDFEFIDALKPLEDEIIIDKSSVSAFNSTAIDQVLRNMRRDILWICGVVTEGCVELTTRDAADKGYFCTIVTDGCASSRRTTHEDAVQRITDGNVVKGRTADQLIKMSSA